MTVTPAETGLSGSQTYILKHLQTGRRHVLKQLPRDRSIDQIRWTQSLADFVRSYGNTLLPIALNHHGAGANGFYTHLQRLQLIPMEQRGSASCTSKVCHVKHQGRLT